MSLALYTLNLRSIHVAASVADFSRLLLPFQRHINAVCLSTWLHKLEYLARAVQHGRFEAATCFDFHPKPSFIP